MARKVSVLLLVLVVALACYAKVQESGQGAFIGSHDLVILGAALAVLVVLNVIGRRLRGKDGR